MLRAKLHNLVNGTACAMHKVLLLCTPKSDTA